MLVAYEASPDIFGFTAGGWAHAGNRSEAVNSERSNVHERLVAAREQSPADFRGDAAAEQRRSLDTPVVEGP